MLLRAKGKKTHAPKGASYIFCKRKHFQFLCDCYHSQIGPSWTVCSFGVEDFKLAVRVSAVTEFLLMVKASKLCDSLFCFAFQRKDNVIKIPLMK